MAIMIRNSFQSLIMLIGIICLVTGYANAAKRVALVIGNSDYQNAANLPNPTNDADAITQMLGEMGFDVSTLKDVGYTQMRLALRTFAASAASADIALIFYAGHGMEVDKHNYLIPSDATLAADRDIDFEAVPLDLVTQAAAGAKILSLVLLDACRNNPFAASMKRTNSTRSIGHGLAKVEPTTGTLISFAAKEGTVAADGNGRNSPYTTALINHLQQPGLEINILFRKVRDAVLRDTRGSQEPFTYSSLPGDQIFLVEPENGKQNQREENQEKITTESRKDEPLKPDARTVYNDIKNSGEISTLEIFIKQFPNSIYTKFARSKIKALREARLSDEKSLESESSNKRVSKIDGNKPRGWLGVQIQPVTDEIADTLGLKKAKGALVTSVALHGPAAKAQMKPGDLILSFDGKDVKTMRDLPKIVGVTPVGKDVNVTVFRKGKKITLGVSVGKLETTQKQKPKSKNNDSPGDQIVSSLGMSLGDITKAIRQSKGIRDSVEGAIILKVEDGSKTQEKNIKTDEIIAEVGQKKVKTARDVVKRFAELKAQGRTRALLLLSTKSGDIRFVVVPIDG